MRVCCETWTPQSADDDSLQRAMELIPSILPCQNPCAVHFRKVLADYPPCEYLSAKSTRARRMQWFVLVRQAVRKNEAKMTPSRWWRKHGATVMQSIGFVLVILLAGVIGALCFKRCAEKSGKLVK